MIQVTTVAQAMQAAERGADIIIAQGGEAGGYAGDVSTMALVPQVVDAVAPIPVVAAGGIFDGRGIAAALMLGAAGVNLGTRFIACRESPAPEEWTRAIVAAKSEDIMKAEELNDLVPLPGTAGFGTVALDQHGISRSLERQSRGGTTRARAPPGRDHLDYAGGAASRDAAHSWTDRRRHNGHPSCRRIDAPACR